jgi:hypothetical protein
MQKERSSSGIQAIDSGAGRQIGNRDKGLFVVAYHHVNMTEPEPPILSSRGFPMPT